MSDKNYVLAIDTAMRGCGACVHEIGSDVFHERVEIVARGQSERLVPIIEDLMVQAGIGFERLGAVVTTIGPGAFAGLRIGMSTARAYALALDIPVFGITTTQAMAMQYARKHAPSEAFSVILETKRKDFYLQSFDKNAQALDTPAAITHDQMKVEKTIIGDGAVRYQSHNENVDVIGGFDLIAPEILAYIYTHHRDLCIESPDPVYLRNADVSISKKPQRVMCDTV